MELSITEEWLMRRAALEDGHDVHACNCIGPQNGQPVCPCRMRGVSIEDGRCFWIGAKKRWVQQYGPYFAIGSGFRIAMGSLAAGASAEQAVKIACDLDCYTRGPVDTLRAANTPMTASEIIQNRKIGNRLPNPGAVQFVET